MTAVSSETLKKSIRFAKGVGDKLAQVLAKKKIFNIEDALYFFPRAYEDRRRIYQVHELPNFGTVSVLGRVLRAHPVSYSRRRQKFYDLWLEDLERPSNLLQLRWFHRPYVLEKLKPGFLILARGELQAFRGQRQLSHPEIEVLGRESEAGHSAPGYVPVYSQTEGLYQKTIRRIEKNLLSDFSSSIDEILPNEILERRNLIPRAQAFREIHFPPSDVSFDLLLRARSPAQQRLIYEDFFLFQCALHLQTGFRDQEAGRAFSKPAESWEVLKKNLGFRFTDAQRRVLKEILDDMIKPYRMHRLVQGDVGSGKTAVALASALIALESGTQVALMAPTEVLVEQHYQKAQALLKGLPYPVLRLTGSLKSQEKKEILKALKSPEPLLVCGTHALFEDKVQFHQLGLVIVDEQHRFGVRQRSALIAKGDQVDVLVMTATPIPRSLALTLYGDLDLSLIDELPPGRQPIKTRMFRANERSLLIEKIHAQLAQGRQAYMVYPLIEESEALSLQSIQQDLPALKEDLAPYRVEALHGRMDSQEKQKLLNEFRDGKIQVLVSTTVIEVGVDVPNATLMIVQHAERFGLSQLHQLRGRVGRGSFQSHCFLVASHTGSPEILKRLKTMEATNDGFQIAEIDLEMRGPGEFLGTRQSGLPDFRLALLPRDLEILQMARCDVREVLSHSPNLSAYPKLRAQIFDSLKSQDLS